jgi:hypothetical protein
MLGERGEDAEPEAAAKLITVARETAQPAMIAMGCAAGAKVMLAKGQRAEATSLLNELERTKAARDDPYYAAQLPDLVRQSLRLGDRALAVRFTEGIEPRTPLQRHALAASRASVAEAGGDHTKAATAYADVARQWRDFGDVPELAYALLGQGRCLVSLGVPNAAGPLADARALFASMSYRPALFETERLLADAAAAAH